MFYFIVTTPGCVYRISPHQTIVSIRRWSDTPDPVTGSRVSFLTGPSVPLISIGKPMTLAVHGWKDGNPVIDYIMTNPVTLITVVPGA
jgi:hypothetical protein